MQESDLQGVQNLAEALQYDTLLDVPITTGLKKIRTLNWSPTSALGDNQSYIRYINIIISELIIIMIIIRIALIGNNHKLHLVTCDGNNINVNVSMTS